MQQPLFETSLTSLKPLYQGKVRDIFEIDDEHMLIVTTDRLSAFDVILPTPIPGKGEVLTSVSNFWFAWLKDMVRNHLSSLTLEDVIANENEREPLVGRSVIVKRLKALPVEAIVRGYLIGSGWKDYSANSHVCGMQLPQGLRQAEILPEAIFTPSTKAEMGTHDVNVDFAHVANLLGLELAEKMRDISVQIYTRAAKYAKLRGIIIADTKFEFGLDDTGELVLIDEVLTPDSSRFWPLDGYKVGISPPSFDKQFVRDYLETLDWDKTAPGPELPENIALMTATKYAEAKRLLTS